jgi:hypothetical protein
MAVMTEAEAKKKWCPHARAKADQDLDCAVNRAGHGPDPECICLASACMAWRWGEAAADVPRWECWWPETEDEAVLRGVVGPDRTDEVPASAQWIPMTGSDEADDHEGGRWEEPEIEHQARVVAARNSRRGFCGAFGTPAEES